ncbi:nucleotidyltransferase family protein [Micromonospora sp. CB01531]|uniref:nucleotidyltransferase family protein n=1 Tax=Micromonospora sp. CB01531 TaxID=1718947 RepID=UPI00093E4D8B|nr:nucleotidyltransferase family protein [Micromonospora sp. CB01531]
MPDAWIGAGAIGELVWSERYGERLDPSSVRDTDAFFSRPDAPSWECDPRRLVAAWPDTPWEAKNQAAMHTWYPAKFSTARWPPLRTIADEVAARHEYPTAVAVRLDAHDRLVVCGPYGLDDLLDEVRRRNSTRVSPEISWQRLARHRPAERWPRVRVMP